MKLGSSSHADIPFLEHAAKPGLTQRPSVDGTFEPAKHAGADAFGALLNAGTSLSGLLPPLLDGGQAPPQGPAAGGTGGGGELGELAQTAGEGVLGAIPVVGNVMSGMQALQALSKGNVGDALLDGIGALPGLGNGVTLAEGGAKLAEGVAKLA